MINLLISSSFGLRIDPCGMLATQAAAADANLKLSTVFSPFKYE